MGKLRLLQLSWQEKLVAFNPRGGDFKFFLETLRRDLHCKLRQLLQRGFCYGVDQARWLLTL